MGSPVVPVCAIQFGDQMVSVESVRIGTSEMRRSSADSLSSTACSAVMRDPTILKTESRSKRSRAYSMRPPYSGFRFPHSQEHVELTAAAMDVDGRDAKAVERKWGGLSNVNPAWKSGLRRGSTAVPKRVRTCSNAVPGVYDARAYPLLCAGEAQRTAGYARCR